MPSMKCIIATSTGLTDYLIARIELLASKLNGHRAIIIVNAVRDGKSGKYVVLAQSQLATVGFEVRLVDVLEDDISEVNIADLIYIAGGNTYKLMDDLNASGVSQIIKRRLEGSHPLIYIGVSAGSVILGPDLSMSGDENETGKELDGLGVIPDIVMPHFSLDQEEQAQAIERNNHTVLRLYDGGYKKINL